ncbi:hypothetical protein [Thalassospira lucentensis]|uniref:Nucleoside phosphorylase domain-containing protein n=1 Tax=Thalassospira lucentensis TaxID=168935 RepID=A0A3D5N953_9PROT|nr:hypothetical protein [Thalassospira lucentensis]HCW67162.1 hypothetical protein [Thalassospira lucentensis]
MQAVDLETVLDKEYFDLIVVVPLEEEMAAAKEIFGVDLEYDDATKYIFSCSLNGLNLLFVQQEEMGKTAASRAVSETFRKFNAPVVACVGIAGGLSRDLNLCDVCYSGTVIDVYDNAKASDQIDGTMQIDFSPKQYRTKNTLTASINFSRQRDEHKELYLGWEGECVARMQDLLPGGLPDIRAERSDLMKPISMNGSIACSVVSKSKDLNERLKRLDRKILAIETESGGVFEEAERLGVLALAIRGVSDYADDKKEELEKNTGGAVRKLAALNAMSFLRLQVFNPSFKSFLAKNKQIETAVNDNQSNCDHPDDATTALLQVLAEEVHCKLRELSPDFRIQLTGYRLPTPRIKSWRSDVRISDVKPRESVEIRDALVDNSKLLISVPRTYPDDSLAWVIADDLISADIGNSAVIPIVVDGRSIRPPRLGLFQVSCVESTSFEAIDESQIVFIVQDFEMNSKSRINFLSQQMEKYPEAKYIFLTKQGASTLQEGDFSSSHGIEIFELCKISFFEMAHFIQRKFEMGGQESEVIAKRLFDTFQRFNLSAHPTYLAGIPKETLFTILQANRRGELIQMAVDGFLSFLVADDKQDVTLSRTTRSLFLRSLVREIKVNGRSFDNSGLMEFTTNYAKEFGYDIDPWSFIEKFIDKGVLHFEGGNICFSIPFVEAHLLAVELSSQPELARKYFNLHSDDFDIYTFDLYCELGVPPEIIESVSNELIVQCEELKLLEGEEHILLSGKVRPEILKHPRRLKTVQENLGKMAENLYNSTGDAKGKQSVIDLSSTVREMAFQRRVELNLDEELDVSPMFDVVGYALHVWIVSVVLLGSGAERVRADQKTKIVKDSLRLLSLIIHHWTSAVSAFDFPSMKERVVDHEAYESMRELIIESGIASDEVEAKKFLFNLIDVVEISQLSEPFRRTVSMLCEQAGQSVLASTIESSEAGDFLSEILRCIWLADLSHSKGKSPLQDALTKVPREPFIATILAQHFLDRVYWSHWKKEQKLLMLDAAESVVKKINQSFDKSKLKRVIERDGPKSSAEIYD